MKFRRSYSSDPIFPDFIVRDTDDTFAVPEEEASLLLNDSFYPGTEGPTMHKQPLKGIALLSRYIIAIAFIFLAYGARVWSLQISHNQEFTSLAEGRRVSSQLVAAPRGIIYDQARRPLAVNTAQLALTLIPAALPDDATEKQALLDYIAQQTGVPLEEILSLLKKAPNYSTDPITIAENIPRETALLLASKNRELPGVGIEQQAGRSYIKDAGLSHLLGYVGSISTNDLENKKLENTDYPYEVSDGIGKTGIEAYYENVLRGKKDSKKIEINNVGAQVRLLKKAEPIPGNNIVLSIDEELQKKSREILASALAKNGATGGVVIIENPNTGDILSMVSLPDYDNNVFTGGISQKDYSALLNPENNNPLLNRAISGQYPPGSVFKPFVALGALNDGNITPRTSFIDPGFIKIGAAIFPTWLWQQYGRTHGVVDVARSLEESVDTFYYIISGGYNDHPGMGSDAIAAYVKQFGFDGPTGIDLPSEKSGTIPSAASFTKEGKKWRIGDTYHMSIGQGFILVTPLQIVNATSVIANGGTLYKPRLLKELLSEDQTTLFPQQPIVLRQQFVDTDYLDIVKQGMARVIYGSHGTARDLRTLPVKIAGKTGTAQFQNNTKEHAWFTAFAPYDQPEIAMVVLVEGGGEGSAAAAPVAKEIMQWYFRDRFQVSQQQQLDSLAPEDDIYHE